MVRFLSMTGIPFTDNRFGAIAWPVDFNLNLISFEKHLQGTRNLVDYALSSPFIDPPRLMFISSIGIFRRKQQFPFPNPTSIHLTEFIIHRPNRPHPGS